MTESSEIKGWVPPLAKNRLRILIERDRALEVKGLIEAHRIPLDRIIFGEDGGWHHRHNMLTLAVNSGAVDCVKMLLGLGAKADLWVDDAPLAMKLMVSHHINNLPVDHERFLEAADLFIQAGGRIDDVDASGKGYLAIHGSRKFPWTMCLLLALRQGLFKSQESLFGYVLHHLKIGSCLNEFVVASLDDPFALETFRQCRDENGLNLLDRCLGSPGMTQDTIMALVDKGLKASPSVRVAGVHRGLYKGLLSRQRLVETCGKASTGASAPAP